MTPGPKSGISNLQLYEWWREGGINLVQHKVSETFPSTENEEENILRCQRFVNRIENKWKICNRTEKRLKNKYGDWLQEISYFKSTASLNSRGRPPKENFEDNCERGKRKKTEELVREKPLDQLGLALSMKLRKENRNADARLVQEVVERPEVANELLSLENLKRSPVLPASPEEAAFFLIEIDASEAQYKRIRLFCKEHNADVFPEYNKVVEAKKQSYPPAESMEVSEKGVKASLQAIVDHTTKAILHNQGDILDRLTDSQLMRLKATFKWGADGSSSYAGHKQDQERGGSLTSDSHVFLTSIVPLQIECVPENEPDVCIVWRNPSPSSPYFCRPLNFQRRKETEELSKKEFSRVEVEIKALEATTLTYKNRTVAVKHEMHCTMVDGKMVANILGTSMQTCDICNLTPKDLNDINKIEKQPINKSALQFGASPLHQLLRFFSLVISLALHLPFKKWRVTGAANQNAMKARKRDLQLKFHSELGIQVDVPKSGGVGTSTNGNTARVAFQNVEKLSQITGVSQELLTRFALILRILRAGYTINIAAFSNYCKETMIVHLKEYKWYYMPCSVHKILMHGADIVAASPLPLGMFSEEPQEARNKHIRKYDALHSYRGSWRTANLQIFQRLLISSDPRIIASWNKKKKQNSIDQDMLALLETSIECAADIPDW